MFIIPAAVGLTGVLINYLKNSYSSYIPFLLGIVTYTLIYPVFRKPLTSYIIGHELTHVLGVWLSRGKVHSVRVSKRGGMVRADRINIWTALLPYFFPIYTFLVLGIYFALSIFLDMHKFYGLMLFILGATWAFHFWMTFYILRYNQPDIKYGGFLFSIIIIFTINIAILILLFTFISPDINTWQLICESSEKIKDSYLWILKKLV